MSASKWVVAVGLFSLASAALGQAASTSEKPLNPQAVPGAPARRVFAPDAPQFGTAQTWQAIGAPDFDPDLACNSGCTAYTSSWNPPGNYTYRRWVTGGYPHLLAYPRLPGGVLVNGIEYDTCDTNASGQTLTINVYDCDFVGNCNSSPLSTYTTTNGNGCVGSVAGFPSYTVDNYNKKLLVEAVFSATDGSNSLAGVSFGYTYQVSPAPGAATFLDVPVSNPQFQFVEALVAAGVTAGCGSGNYCPNNPVTRGQMAVFLSKALGLNWDDH